MNSLKIRKKKSFDEKKYDSSYASGYRSGRYRGNCDVKERIQLILLSNTKTDKEKIMAISILCNRYS